MSSLFPSPNSYLPLTDSWPIYCIFRLILYNYIIFCTTLFVAFPDFAVQLLDGMLWMAILAAILLVLDLGVKFAIVERRGRRGRGIGKGKGIFGNNNIQSLNQNKQLQLGQQSKPLPTIIQSTRTNTPTKMSTRIRRTLRHYLWQHSLWLDLLCVFVFLLFRFQKANYARWMCLPILVLFKDILALNELFYSQLNNRRFARICYTILKIVYAIIMFSHIFACIFYLIDQTLIDTQYYGDPSLYPLLYYQMRLLCYSPIEALDDAGRYLYALYYMVSLVTTIAFGDIIGKNAIEEVFVTVMMVASTISSAFIFEQFINLVTDNIFDTSEFSHHFSFMKGFMQTHKLTPSLQNQVRNYLLHDELEQCKLFDGTVLDRLTPQLCRSVLYNGYGSLYERPFRQLGIAQPYLLSQHLREVLFHAGTIPLEIKSPNASLVLTHDEDDTIQERQGVYFWLQGDFETYIQKDQFSQPLLVPFNPPVFGLHQLVTGQMGTYSIHTLEMCKFVYLPSDTFENYLKDRLEERRLFRAMKQKLLCREISFEVTCYNCLICLETDHWLGECPEAHYAIKPNMVGAIDVYKLLHQVRYTQQKRSPFVRRQTKLKRIENLKPLDYESMYLKTIGRQSKQSANSFSPLNLNSFLAEAYMRVKRAKLNKQLNESYDFCNYRSDSNNEQFNLQNADDSKQQ